MAADDDEDLDEDEGATLLGSSGPQRGVRNPRREPEGRGTDAYGIAVRCLSLAAGGGLGWVIFGRMRASDRAAAPRRRAAAPAAVSPPARTTAPAATSKAARRPRAVAAPTAADAAPTAADAASKPMMLEGGGLTPALEAWLDARHTSGRCDHATAVYFAPTSPNGIGNKLLGLAMAFHVALMGNRRLVVTDWPPTTLAKTSYQIGDILRPSSCQSLFDHEPNRQRVVRCTMAACPLRTASQFRDGFTQPHWAHASEDFLKVPPAFKHLAWPAYWRAITQYLFSPSDALLHGLAGELSSARLVSSPAGALPPRLPTAHPPAGTAPAADGFSERFGRSVASWSGVALPRPLIGAHVRLGDGCWDSKRGGCKYVKSFGDVVAGLRAAGITRGTIYLATDNATVAAEALRSAPEGFVVAALHEDRKVVEASHHAQAQEGDKMLHLQLLDLALLSQADVLVGVLGSTFIKTALQLGVAKSYVSLDTLPWCPLLRCYWGWADLCHNCDLCQNMGGVGEACADGATCDLGAPGGERGGGGCASRYHTPLGLLRARQNTDEQTRPFRAFTDEVLARGACRPWALHPQPPPGATAFAPVVGSFYAAKAPLEPPPPSVCAVRGRGVGVDCACGFVRYAGVDNAAAQRAPPASGYGLAPVPLGAKPSLGACEAACCAEPTCHSAVFASYSGACTLSLTLAYGSRPTDWCWHPKLAPGVTSSLRAPGAWEAEALSLARRVIGAPSLAHANRSVAGGYIKQWGLERHYGMPGHVKACVAAEPSRALRVSDAVAAAIPLDPGRCRGRG